MKKTLAAVAVLGAFAGSALAADVTLYGKVDLGLQYKMVDNDGMADADHSWGLNSGNSGSSRFGFKGSEQISEDLTVGFQLENGLYADSGKMKGENDRLFDRESRLYVKGAFGEVAFGRMGNLNSGNGTYGIMGKSSAFGTAWGSALGGHEVTFGWAGTRYDNTVTYKSPSFAGVTAYAQYAMGDDSVENTSKTNRYAALGMTADYGALHAVMVVDQLNKKSFDATTGVVSDPDDQVTVSAGMTYDFGVVKAGLTAQYFQHMDKIEAKSKAGILSGDVKGYGVALSASAPVYGGTVAGVIGYLDAEDDNDTAKDMTRYNVGATYMYPLSKRTSIYAGAGYIQEEVSNVDGKYVEVVSGIVHNF